MPETRRDAFTQFVKPLIRILEGEPAVEKPGLRVTSHVARDLLQNAAYFNSVPKAVAEYVSNAIDNAAAGKPVRCQVTLSRAEIRIADNASGMSFTELSNFFQMHGENIQRRRGRAVRGKFGTGKSAAFGIADTLQIETVNAGKRNVVELRRADVEAAKDGAPIPVRAVVTNESTRAHSGTTIVIRDLHAKNVDADATRAYLEKILGRHLHAHSITVNGVECKYHEPDAVKLFRFRAPREVAEKIGGATATLKISREPLTREENVIAVLSNGFLLATTLAGKQGELFMEYVFGAVDAPGLDNDRDPAPAIDNTRGLTLNATNPRVQALNAWLGDCIEQVRQELIEREKRRRYSKEMRLLNRISGEIQILLNDDFRVVQETLPWATMPGARRRARRNARRSAVRMPRPSLIERGRDLVDKLLGRGEKDAATELAKIRRGGRVEFEINCVRMGKDLARARYISARRAIYINRDHPQIRTAETEAGLTSLTFKMILFDVAFTEYALAVVSQLADQGVEVADPIDATEMVQEILDRLNRKAAEKFATEIQARTGPPALDLAAEEEVEITNNQSAV